MECKKCGSTNTVKNGHTLTGQLQYHCRTCGVYTVTGDHARDRAIKMEIVEKLHRERVSQRGIARVTGISRTTMIRWLRKKVLHPIGATILLSSVPQSGSSAGPLAIDPPQPAASSGYRCLPIIANAASFIPTSIASAENAVAQSGCAVACGAPLPDRECL